MNQVGRQLQNTLCPRKRLKSTSEIDIYEKPESSNTNDRYSHNFGAIFQISKFDNLKGFVKWRKVLPSIQIVRTGLTLSIGILHKITEISFQH